MHVDAYAIYFDANIPVRRGRLVLYAAMARFSFSRCYLGARWWKY